MPATPYVEFNFKLPGAETDFAANNGRQYGIPKAAEFQIPQAANEIIVKHTDTEDCVVPTNLSNIAHAFVEVQIDAQASSHQTRDTPSRRADKITVTVNPGPPPVTCE